MDMAYCRFLGVGTMFDIFQNIILVPYLEYGVLIFSGYGVLVFILCGRLVSAGTDTPYLLDGYRSDTKVFTMTMEILPEPTSHKLCCSDEVLKLKNFKKDENTSFQEQEKYEHVGLKVTSTKDSKISQDDDSRLCSADDLKEA
ncbi:hypothetical protein Tco_0544828 [Tanacetum coccineum]